jgi:hypothetical protein
VAPWGTAHSCDLNPQNSYNLSENTGHLVLGTFGSDVTGVEPCVDIRAELDERESSDPG